MRIHFVGWLSKFELDDIYDCVMDIAVRVDIVDMARSFLAVVALL